MPREVGRKLGQRGSLARAHRGTVWGVVEGLAHGSCLFEMGNWGRFLETI